MGSSAKASSVAAGPRSGLFGNLVVFQVGRLRRTYADFAAAPRFQHIARFFFEDVYSTEDKAERDAQFKQLYESFRKKLGAEITAGVGELVALNELSNELDQKLAIKLGEIVPGDSFDEPQYERAYALCDNYGDRLIQIETLGHCIRYFHGLGQNFLIGVALTAVKAAAGLFGGEIVIGFLDRGYHAYRSVTKSEIEQFETAVTSREMARLDRIYGRTPCPA